MNITLSTSSAMVTVVKGTEGRPDWDKLVIPVSGIEGCKTVSINEPSGMPEFIKSNGIFRVVNVKPESITLEPLDEAIYGAGKFGASMTLANLTDAIAEGAQPFSFPKPAAQHPTA